MPSDERERLAARARGKDRPLRFRVRRGTEGAPRGRGGGSAEPRGSRQEALF
jgi:hypothetical protein